MEIRNGRKVSPRSIKSEEVRNRILETGYQMIREYGFDMVGVRDIAEKSGVSTGTLYYYFASKEAIVWAHAMANAEKFSAGLQNLSSKTAFSRIVEFCVDCLGDVLAEDGSEIIFWILQEKQVHTTLFSVISTLVQDGIDSGEFTSEKTAEELAHFILDCYRGAAFAWYRSEGKDDIKKLLLEHVSYPLEHFLAK